MPSKVTTIALSSFAVCISLLAPTGNSQPLSMYPQIDREMYSLIEKEQASNPSCENVLIFLTAEKANNPQLKLEEVAPFKYTKGAVVGAYISVNGDDVRLLKQYQTRVIESFAQIETLCKSGNYEYYSQALRHALSDNDTKKCRSLNKGFCREKNLLSKPN